MKISKLLFVLFFQILFGACLTMAQVKFSFSPKSADLNLKNTLAKVDNPSMPKGFSWQCTDLSTSHLNRIDYSIKNFDGRGKLLKDTSFVWVNSLFKVKELSYKIYSSKDSLGNLKQDTVLVLDDLDFELKNQSKEVRNYKISCNYWPQNARSASIFVESSTFEGAKYYAPGY